jgi:hypothetical protein
LAPSFTKPLVESDYRCAWFVGGFDVNVAIAKDEYDFQKAVTIGWSHKPQSRRIGLVFFPIV